MNLVVGFLSMLNADEENGGVKRMLGVCSEFERIAKVVLDKAEKETSSRRKRKSNEDPKTKLANGQNPHAPPQTPMTNNTQPNAMGGLFSPNMGQQLNPQQNGYSPVGTGSSPNSQWQPDFTNGNDYMSPNGMTPFADMQGYAPDMNSPLNATNFQQPFVPQDLWQMPMTLEWDWADMTGGQYPSFENGVMGDPSLHNSNNQHLQHQPLP